MRAPGTTDVYAPAEDTAALARALRAYSGEMFLEIGFGSGAILQGAVARFRLVVGTDLLTVKQAVSLKVDEADMVLSDRASCFRPGVFDVVAFNPPYLPSEKVDDRTVDGGRGGLEVPLSFLDDAVRVLRPGGVVVMIVSDEANLDDFRKACEARGLRVSERARTSVFFENLVVFEVRRDPSVESHARNRVS